MEDKSNKIYYLKHINNSRLKRASLPTHERHTFNTNKKPHGEAALQPMSSGTPKSQNITINLWKWPKGRTLVHPNAKAAEHHPTKLHGVWWVLFVLERVLYKPG